MLLAHVPVLRWDLAPALHSLTSRHRRDELRAPFSTTGSALSPDGQIDAAYTAPGAKQD
jgi:hypothetical protein